MTKISRRTFLQAAGIGGAALSVLGPRSLAFAAVPTYTGSTYHTATYKCTLPGQLEFAKLLAENGKGEFEGAFYDSGTLLKEDEQLAGMRANTIQYMFHTTSYITRSMKALGVTGLPKCCEELWKNKRWGMESPLWKHINDRLASDDIFMLTVGSRNFEPEFIWSSKRNRIARLDDLKGKRIRIVSYEATELMKSFDVSGVRIPSSETYIALQRGTVDGMICTVSTTIGRKLEEQVDVCYQLPCTGFAVGVFMLRSFWDKLPDKHRAIFWETAKVFDATYGDNANETWFKGVYWPYLQKGGMEIVPPSQEDYTRLETVGQPIRELWKKDVGEQWGQKAIELALGGA
jgi:TRAP-type C4-dicarboxylate transport system substrate-binding protein